MWMIEYHAQTPPTLLLPAARLVIDPTVNDKSGLSRCAWATVFDDTSRPHTLRPHLASMVVIAQPTRIPHR